MQNNTTYCSFTFPEVCNLNQVAPPLIPLRPPIPERKTNERPLFLIRNGTSVSGLTSQVEEQLNSKRDDDRTSSEMKSIVKKTNNLESKQKGIDLSVYWAGGEGSNNGDKLIDLDTSRSTGREEQRNSLYSSSGSLKAIGGNVVATEAERQIFVADFHGNFEERPPELRFKSSFEELRKVSRDLEKRLHEGIVRNVVMGGCGGQCARGETQGERTTRQVGQWQERDNTKDSRCVFNLFFILR